MAIKACGSTNFGYHLTKLTVKMKLSPPSMTNHHSLLSRYLTSTCTIFLLVAGTALTVSGQIHPPPLSDSARQNERNQIRALMAGKAQWTKAQQKLDSQLIFAKRLQATGIVHPLAPKLRPDARAEADGRYKVEIKATLTPGLLAAIEAAGGTILSSMPSYHVIQAALPVEKMEAIAARDEVVYIRPPPRARHNAVDSEGDFTHQAIDARNAFNVDGAGITVGVMSGSIDNGSNALAQAVAEGNIDETNTFIIPGQAGTGDGEGLAMCEIVHDLAPGARIGFATSSTGEAQMASNILALAAAGCNIICDDEAYDDESPFQDGVIAQAVQTVTAQGVLYVSCARNSGNLTDGTSSTWESDFTNAGDVYIDGAYVEQMEFGRGYAEDAILNYGYDFEADLFWSDPLGGSTNDYDLYMVDSLGDIVYSSQNTQNGTQDPYENIPDTAQYSSGYYLVVVLYNGVSRYMHLDFGRGALDYASSGCVKGHNACDATNFLSVAATPAATAYSPGGTVGPYPNPFSSSDVVEPFSADGPRIMFYNSDGSAITPGNLSITGGKILRKPDLTAADGVTTSEAGFAPFFGTSAATPHAAAIAALVWSYNRALTASQVEAVLTNSCIKIMGAPGWDRNSGYGILMANLALSNTPPPTITSSHLAFTTQPGGGPAGTVWAIQPVVTLQDGSGRVVTGTPQNVTLALQNGGLGATLNGNVTVATVAGVATFAGLSINQPGSGYTLTVTGNTVDTTPGTVVSSGFNVTATVSSGPPLSLAFSGGVILLTWPTIPARFNLQSSRKLGPSAAWTTVSPSVVAGGENIVAIIPSEAQQFFRLGE